MPLEPIQQLAECAKLETTQMYVASTTVILTVQTKEWPHPQNVRGRMAAHLPPREGRNPGSLLIRLLRDLLHLMPLLLGRESLHVAARIPEALPPRRFDNLALERRIAPWPPWLQCGPREHQDAVAKVALASTPLSGCGRTISP